MIASAGKPCLGSTWRNGPRWPGVASALADSAACAAFHEDPHPEKAAAFEYRVHRRSPSELVLASTPEKGLPPPWLKCFYDVRSDSLLRAQPFGPFTVVRSGRKRQLVFPRDGQDQQSDRSPLLPAASFLQRRLRVRAGRRGTINPDAPPISELFRSSRSPIHIPRVRRSATRARPERLWSSGHGIPRKRRTLPACGQPLVVRQDVL